jgi:hypothetical protein
VPAAAPLEVMMAHRFGKGCAVAGASSRHSARYRKYFDGWRRAGPSHSTLRDVLRWRRENHL